MKGIAGVILVHMGLAATGLVMVMLIPKLTAVALAYPMVTGKTITRYFELRHDGYGHGSAMKTTGISTGAGEALKKIFEWLSDKL